MTITFDVALDEVELTLGEETTFDFLAPEVTLALHVPSPGSYAVTVAEEPLLLFATDGELAVDVESVDLVLEPYLQVQYVGGAPLSNTPPMPVTTTGSASPGVATDAARADHVHRLERVDGGTY